MSTLAAHEGRMMSVPRRLAFGLLRDLRRRGRGVRESGAFLLGVRGERVDAVVSYVCYDDLDPGALDLGYVVMTSVGYSALWARCRELRLDVLADVHTHPGGPPRQSHIDRANPMISERGHIAIVLPHFAQMAPRRERDLAVYEYEGNYRWRDWTGRSRKSRLQFVSYLGEGHGASRR